jgi:hypothetical protein
MRWLIPVDVVLMLAGGAGATAAYVQSARPHAGESASTNGVSGGGVPADQANRSHAGALILAPLAGLAMALGVGCVGVGMGRWSQPLSSYQRPATPWNDQPADKGGPPVGLV